MVAYLAAIIYRHPSRRIFVMGVTGTKGKSTVIEMINSVLEEAGLRTAISSSLRVKVGERSLPGDVNNTMRGRGFLQKFLRESVQAGCDYALVEVTSEGVRQHRHRFIDFDSGLLVNLHPEHIESHGSFEKYKQAKLDFFRDIRRHSKKGKQMFFVNRLDPSADDFMRAAEGGEIHLYAEADTPVGMRGGFNRVNAGAAEAVGRALGIEEEAIKRALAAFYGVPGRMEFVEEHPLRVVVDYAHTPDSLEAVYQALTKNGNRKLICVLGSCGGGRDKWKRPKLGEIASRYCREIILTDEDPFDENPEEILAEIRAGIPEASFRSEHVHEVVDRGEAIDMAISLAEPGDTVVITGKGSEPYIRVAKGEKIPWSDKEKALQAIKKHET